MDEFEGFMGGFLDELGVFDEGVVDDLVADGGHGVCAAEGVECSAAVASFFEEFAAGGVGGGLAGIDAAAGAAEKPLFCGVAVFFVDDEFSFFGACEDGGGVGADVDASVAEVGAVVELEEIDADVEEAGVDGFAAFDGGELDAW